MRERLFAKITVNPVTQCWEWQGTIAATGYGQLTLATGKSGGKAASTHRLSWQEFRGPIPDGLWVLHKCDVKRCINPDHLFLGTHTDNVRDCIAKGGWPSRQGENGAMAKLTNAKVRLIRKLCAIGRTQASFARRFKVNPSAVSRAVRGETWRNVLS